MITTRETDDGRNPGAGAQEGEDREMRAALADDSAESLYENAPCGYLSTLPDGRIAKVNATLLEWLGLRRDELVGRRYFSDLLTVGSRLYHETHFAPLLRMQGEISGIALELKAADGARLPVLVTSVVRYDSDGQPLLIRTTVFDARERRAYETELLRARREAEDERRRLQRLTRTLRATFLPPDLPEVPGLDVAAHYHIASPDEVGGDFYDVFPLGAGTWGLFLGDVCGKGAAAAVMTSVARYTVRAAAVYASGPAAVLADLNAVLVERYRTPDPRFCTVVFGTLAPDVSPGSFRVTLASGGHPPALLLRADGSADYVPIPGGQLIGLLPRAHIASAVVRLDPGDTLVLYTDGLTEARSAPGADERYGEQALLDFARMLGPVTAAEAVTAVRDLLDFLGTGVEDDTAVLAVHAPRRGVGS